MILRIFHPHCIKASNLAFSFFFPPFYISFVSLSSSACVYAFSFLFIMHVCHVEDTPAYSLFFFFTSSLHNRKHTTPPLFVLFFNLYSHERVLLQRFGSTDRNEDLVLSFVLLMFEYLLLKCVWKERTRSRDTHDISIDLSISSLPHCNQHDELLQPRLLLKAETHNSC